MDDRVVFARTELGRNELLGTEHALKQRQRQVLFLITDAISVGELRAKLPACQELDAILEHLWEAGFVGQVKRAGMAESQMGISDALNVLGHSRLEGARQHAMRVVASLAGEQSPAYARLKSARDTADFTQAVALAKKMLATVASAHQAAAFEGGVLAILHLPESDTLPPSSPNPNPARMNGIESAKAHALDVFRVLVGEKSPVYAKLNAAHNRAEFAEAVAVGKKVIAAVASSTKAGAFESEVMARLEEH